jgi:hypothetical protein
MKKLLAWSLAFATLAMLIGASPPQKLDKNTATPPPSTRPISLDDYYYLREKYLARLKKGEKERERRKREAKLPYVEDQLEIAFDQWDRYWRDHMDAGARKRGKLADMSNPLRSYYEAMIKSRARQSGLSAQSTSLVCPSSGLGNWSLLGPSTYPAPIMGKVTSVFLAPASPNTAYAGAAEGGLFKTINNGASWASLTDASHYPALGVTSIAVDPSVPTTIYIATSNGSAGSGGTYGFGILKSIDGGTSWQEVFTLAPYDNQTNYNVGEESFVSMIMLHPQDPNCLYVLARHYVFRSTDAGTTWQKVLEIVPPSSNPDGCGYRLVDIDIINGGSGVADSHVIVSTIRSAWLGTMISPCGTAKSFVSAAGGAILTWTEITDPNGPVNVLAGDPTDRISTAVQPGNNSEFFLAYQKMTDDYGNGPLVVRKYNFITNSSSLVGTITANGYFQLGAGYWGILFEFSKLNPNTFYLGGTTVYRASLASPFVGSNPSQISSYAATSGSGTPLAQTHGDVRSMTVGTSGSNDVLIAGTDGGIHKAVLNPNPAMVYNSTTANWHDMTGPGLAINEFFDVNGLQSNADVVVAGAQDNGTFKYNNGTWEQAFNCDGWRGTINQATGEYFGIVNCGSISGIKGMTGVSGPFSSVSSPAITGPVVSDPNNPATIYGGGASLYKSTNFATSWTTLPTLPGTANIRAIHVAPSNSNTIYVSREGPTWNPADLSKCLFKSSDGGSTWTDIGVNVASVPSQPLAWSSIMDISVDPENSNRVWISINGYWSTSNTSINGFNRVLYSGDGGGTWSDFTHNLLAFPVSCLTYRRGSNDELFAGTDVGVFRYNASLQLWECFNNMLPIAPVTRMKINYCKNKIVCSTWGRGVWESDLPPLPSKVVNTSVTWNGTSYLSNDLTISPGVTLTLTGTLNMSKGKRIIVQRGATLDVNGGTITNCCGDMWFGIEDWGTKLAPQNLAGAQGKVILRNNARIENALEAIITGKDFNTSFDWNYTGGIVQASNSSFYNNRRSVGFMSYHWMNGSNETNNLSYFKNCTFETNRLLNDPTAMPDAHVSLFDITGVTLYGCKFNNTTSTAVFGVNNRGDGLDCADAQITVDDLFNPIHPVNQPPSVIAPSVFSGLTNGINASFTAGVSKKLTIENSDFNNVQRGVQVNYSIGSLIVGNNFSALPIALTTNFTDATWGVRMNNASGLKVLSNTVTGANNSYQNNYGVIIDNCGGSASNLVKGNTLKNIYTGIQARGANGSSTSGVQFRCNVFQSTMAYQLAVASAATLANQGSVCSTNNTANNTFFGQALPVGSQINSPTAAFNYYASGTVPTNIAGSVTVTNCSVVNGECDSP